MGENDKAKLREALQAALANPQNQAVLRELARTLSEQASVSSIEKVKLVISELAPPGGPLSEESAALLLAGYTDAIQGHTKALDLSTLLSGVVDGEVKPLAFDRYAAERMQDPEVAAAYEAELAEIADADAKAAQAAEQAALSSCVGDEREGGS